MELTIYIGSMLCCSVLIWYCLLNAVKADRDSKREFFYLMSFVVCCFLEVMFGLLIGKLI